MNEREGTVRTDATAWGLVIGGILGAVVGAITDSLSLVLWIAIGIPFVTGYEMP